MQKPGSRNSTLAEYSLVHYEEIFSSINGESTDAGRPCTFIRFFGCPVNCSYCDQPQTKGIKRSIGSVVSDVVALGVPYVCITGGEPLIQGEVLYPLIYELQHKEFEVAVETSGCFPLDDTLYRRSFKYIMDIKCPSSGVSEKNILNNLFKLQHNDEIKFVIKDRKDYEYALNIIRSYQLPPKVIFSPVFDESGKQDIGSSLVQWLLEDKLYGVRVGLQLHKFIGVR